MDYEVVIGLEVHVHLKTNSKMFCGCSTEFGNQPNTQTCPVCLGMPGVLPVMNKKAVELAMKSALALNCGIAPKSVFSRKNYFYPDLPKSYQISQYDKPLAENGNLKISENKTVKIKRVHLEEDAGKLVHSGDGIESAVYSLVDLNRTGTPLLEIVTEPDIGSPEEAYLYLNTLKQILQYIDISDCDMEKGKLRCDANVSIRKKGEPLGVKTELKNMNSFKAVQVALDMEIKRQEGILNEGGRIIQETRLWDEKKGETFSMRSKEEAHDYRYFPEPDLLPVEVNKEWENEIRNSIKDLPADRFSRLKEEYYASDYDAGVLTASEAVSAYFIDSCQHLNPKDQKTIKMHTILITGPVFSICNQQNIDFKDLSKKINVENIAGLTNSIIANEISLNIGKEVVLPEMFKTGKSPAQIIIEKGITQITDESELEKIAEKVIKENPKIAQDYRSGNEKVLGFLVGQLMKATQGRANPQAANKILKEKLK